MKISKTLVAALLSLLTSASYAVTVGSRSNVTVGLTSTYSVGGFLVDGELTFAKETFQGVVSTYDFSQKLKTEKITNKELLTAMAEDDLLDGSIVGWSLVMIDGLEFYAIKKDKSAVPVPVDLSSDENLDVETYTAKSTSNEDTGKETFTGSGSGKTVGYLSISYFDLYAQGIATYSYKAVKGKLGAEVYGSDNGSQAFYLGGASKLSGLSGSATAGLGDTSLVEGSISLSAETVVDLELIGIQLGIGPL